MVDGVGDITDPLGLSGSRLEVQSVIVDAFSPHVKNLIRSVELAGGEISGLVFAPLVAARAALSKRQRDLGVVLVDIGFGTTGMSVYEESKLIGVAKFPVGSGNISNDLGVGLKIPIDAAEEIKLKYGNAVAKDVNSKDLVDITKFVPDAKGPVSRRFIAEIIESRMGEIFDLVNAELKSLSEICASFRAARSSWAAARNSPASPILRSRTCAFPRRSVDACGGMAGRRRLFQGIP